MSANERFRKQKDIKKLTKITQNWVVFFSFLNEYEVSKVLVLKIKKLNDRKIKLEHEYAKGNEYFII